MNANPNPEPADSCANCSCPMWTQGPHGMECDGCGAPWGARLERVPGAVRSWVFKDD